MNDATVGLPSAVAGEQHRRELLSRRIRRWKFDVGSSTFFLNNAMNVEHRTLNVELQNDASLRDIPSCAFKRHPRRRLVQTVVPAVMISDQSTRLDFQTMPRCSSGVPVSR
jgi:hypothetical protein